MKLKGDWHPLNHCGICQRKNQTCQRKVKSVSTKSKHTVTQANGIPCLVRQEVVALCKAADTLMVMSLRVLANQS